MISIEQINGEIAALEEEKPTHIIMQKLAALYTVRDHIVINNGPSTPVVETVPSFGVDNEFSQIVVGKRTQDVMPVISELMDAVSVLQPRLYSSTISKLK